MEPNSDLIDLLHALNDVGAEHVIVGGVRRSPSPAKLDSYDFCRFVARN